MDFELTAIPAFRDNYIWLLSRKRMALVVDPGDAAPVRETLSRHGLRLAAVLVTHHHADHAGGAAALALEYACPVYGPADEAIAAVTDPVREGDQLAIRALDARFEVLDIPGHTAGHVAFSGNNIVFCGDTLFSAGCGRLFEGSAAQMSHSLAKLAALEDQTAVCCGHEYTLANLRFAQALEPGNPDIMAYAEEARVLRERAIPTLPSRIGRERRVNPFLRCSEPAVMAAAARRAGHEIADPVEVFAVIRSWKDNFT
ncbi:MAG TPA: hydroxyacylglutathione hydrolase [Gammaproteobacteria bacterium]|nr:hydroxyacylglutathione hydrolase [Gammaproteobacteria bacterium]